MEEILDALLLIYRTTPHPALTDRSPAETILERKPRTIYNALLVHLHEPIRLATDTAVYVRDRRLNGTWVEDIPRSQ